MPWCKEIVDGKVIVSPGIRIKSSNKPGADCDHRPVETNTTCYLWLFCRMLYIDITRVHLESQGGLLDELFTMQCLHNTITSWHSIMLCVHLYSMYARLR